MRAQNLVIAVRRELASKLAALGFAESTPGRYTRLEGAALQWLEFMAGSGSASGRYFVTCGASPLEVRCFAHSCVEQPLRGATGYAGLGDELAWTLRESVGVAIDDKVGAWFRHTTTWAGLRDELATVGSTHLARAVCEARLGNVAAAAALTDAELAADAREIDWVQRRRRAAQELGEALANGTATDLLDRWHTEQRALESGRGASSLDWAEHVAHPEWGRGRVLRRFDGKVEIDFPGGGTRVLKLDPRFVKLVE